MLIWQGHAQGCCASQWMGWGALLLISTGRWTHNLAEQARLEALISAADTRELFDAACFLATVLAERCAELHSSSAILLFGADPQLTRSSAGHIALRSQRLPPGARVG